MPNDVNNYICSINQDVTRLTTLVGELKTKDEGQLNEFVIDSQTQLSKKLDGMHTVINLLDKQQLSTAEPTTSVIKILEPYWMHRMI